MAKVVITLLDVNIHGKGPQVKVDCKGMTQETFDKEKGSHYAAVVALDAIRAALTGQIPKKEQHELS